MYASTIDQTNGTQRINIQGQNVHTKDQSYALWGHNACTKEQSYRDTRYLCVQRTNPTGLDAQIEDPMSTRCTYSRPILWDAACSYTYLCTCESSMSGTKNHLYGKPSLHKEECYKECFGNNAGEKLRVVQKLST